MGGGVGHLPPGQAVGEGGVGAAKGCRPQQARCRVHFRNHGHAQPAHLDPHPADFPEQGLAVRQADDGLVGLTENVVEAGQTLDLFLGFMPFGNVAHDAMNPLTALRCHPAAADFHRKDAAVGTLVPGFEKHPLIGRVALQVVEIVPVAGGAQIADVAANELLPGIAVGSQSLVIGLDDTALFIEQPDDVVAETDNELEMLAQHLPLNLRMQFFQSQTGLLLTPPQQDAAGGDAEQKQGETA